jgi:hypothetical protein
MMGVFKQLEETKMTELKPCYTCKHYEDYEVVLDWANHTVPKCYHPDRWKSVDYVNGTTSPYGICSVERCTGNCGKIGKNWEAL